MQMAVFWCMFLVVCCLEIISVQSDDGNGDPPITIASHYAYNDDRAAISTAAVYEIFIQYEIDSNSNTTSDNHTYGSTGNLSMVGDLVIIFEMATTETFDQFDIAIGNTQYCPLFSSQFNGTCWFRQMHRHIEFDGAHLIAYGIFTVNASDFNANDDAYEVVQSVEFRGRLQDAIINLDDGVAAYSIISVQVSHIDDMPMNDDDEWMDDTTNMLQLLMGLLSHMLGVAPLVLLAFIALCVLLAAIAKCNGLCFRYDDIRVSYWFYFMVFALHFLCNCIIFQARLVQQRFFVLAIATFITLTLTRMIFDASVILSSRQTWLQHTFSSKHTKEWLKRYHCVLTSLSLVSGPIGAITCVNSRLFARDVFFMAVPPSMVVDFVARLFWKSLLVQRVPELALQGMFLIMNGLTMDVYCLSAMATTVLCIVLSLVMHVQSNRTEQHKRYMIQSTAFLMEISSSEINDKHDDYLLRPNALKRAIANVLDMRTSWRLIEFVCFECIQVSTECSLRRSSIDRCYGLKVYFTVHTVEMARREILMKLEEADDGLAEQIRDAWQLDEEPSIDDIVMVHDLNGDTIIQRAVDPPRFSLEGAQNLEIIHEKKEETDIIRRRRKSTLSKISEDTFDANLSRKSTNPFDEFEEEEFLHMILGDKYVPAEVEPNCHPQLANKHSGSRHKSRKKRKRSAAGHLQSFPSFTSMDLSSDTQDSDYGDALPPHSRWSSASSLHTLRSNVSL